MAQEKMEFTQNEKIMYLHYVGIRDPKIISALTGQSQGIVNERITYYQNRTLKEMRMKKKLYKKIYGLKGSQKVILGGFELN